MRLGGGQGKDFISSKLRGILILLVQNHSLRNTTAYEGFGALCALGGWIHLIYSESQRQGCSGDFWPQYYLLYSWKLEKANAEEDGGKDR